MDVKMPISKHKKWLVLLACIGVMVVLGVTVFALTLPEDAQMASVPDATPTGTLPSTAATQPMIPEDTMPPVQQLPAGSDATAQPSVSLEPDPPVLERNTLTRKDFAKVNGYITCKTEEYWIGIDVSVWQEDIDWEKVAASGVKFAMIRLAYRGWGPDGRLGIDPRGEEHLKGALDAGLKVGVYIYSQATNVQEAIEEAQYLLEVLEGRPLDMPVVFDWEVPTETSYPRTRKVKAKTIHACAMAFCEEIRAAGYQPMVYFNQRQGLTKYNLAELREAGIELWLAMYERAMTYEYKVQMWQYTETGRVPGIDGYVDIDLYFPNY